ncbi:MAG: SH3 domain-containing protein [Chloroflexi bacterium]|nr:SH3 domain-containing protein [Chloroflexota bacterium]
MKRKRDRAWLIAITGILAGFLLGLWVGNQLLPNTSRGDVSQLDPEQQDEYVGLVALGYAQTQNLEIARAQIVRLQAPNPAQLVASVAERQISAGADSQIIAALARLALDLGIKDQSLTAYLPTATPLPPTATPTLAPPTATPMPATATFTVQPTTAAASLTPTSAAATATPTLAPTATPEPAVIASTDMNVRGGPGVEHPVIASLTAGEKAPITGRNQASTWWQILLPDGDSGWVFGKLVATEGDASGVSVPANIPTPPPTPTPAPAAPTATPVPPAPAVDFVVKSVRLWGPEENGGYFDGPSLHCGEKRQLRAIVLDVNGQPLNGVTVLGIYSKVEQVTGGKGPGIAEWVLGNGDGLRVIRDVDGRPVVSETAEGMVTDPKRISDEAFIAAGYCNDAASCQALRNTNACYGHYSWDVVFQRTY